jgi:DNA-binding transcriptional MerR regulator
MVAKARVQKRLYYKIGEACKVLGIQPYVLRYWETEFPALTPSKSRSGQRVYSEKELEIIRRIKELLYDEGYTIAGAKKKLEVELASGPLGEDRDEDETTSEVKPPPPAAPATAAEKPTLARRQPAAPAVVERPALDTGSSERIQTLVSGIEDALREAREIQALLGPKPSP